MSRQSRHPFVALLSLILGASTLTACDSSLAPGGTLDAPLVQVLTESTAAGSAVSVRMQNISSTDWNYNACASPRLQRRDGDTWVDAPEPLIVCTAEVSGLDAGETRTVSVAVPMGYVEGTYRIRFRFIRSDAVEATPVSNTFVVE